MWIPTWLKKTVENYEANSSLREIHCIENRITEDKHREISGMDTMRSILISGIIMHTSSVLG